MKLKVMFLSCAVFLGSLAVSYHSMAEDSSCNYKSASKGMWGEGGPIVEIECGTTTYYVNPYDIAKCLNMPLRATSAQDAVEKIKKPTIYQRVLFEAIRSKQVQTYSSESEAKRASIKDNNINH